MRGHTGTYSLIKPPLAPMDARYHALRVDRVVQAPTGDLRSIGMGLEIDMGFACELHSVRILSAKIERCALDALHHRECRRLFDVGDEPLDPRHSFQSAFEVATPMHEQDETKAAPELPRHVAQASRDVDRAVQSITRLACHAFGVHHGETEGSL